MFSCSAGFLQFCAGTYRGRDCTRSGIYRTFSAAGVGLATGAARLVNAEVGGRQRPQERGEVHRANSAFGVRAEPERNAAKPEPFSNVSRSLGRAEHRLERACNGGRVRRATRHPLNALASGMVLDRMMVLRLLWRYGRSLARRRGKRDAIDAPGGIVGCGAGGRHGGNSTC